MIKRDFKSLTVKLYAVDKTGSEHLHKFTIFDVREIPYILASEMRKGFLPKKGWLKIDNAATALKLPFFDVLINGWVQTAGSKNSSD